jgi:predicted esterase
MEVLSVPAVVHGRVLIEGPADSDRMLVGFHGYGQSADAMLDELRRIPGTETWRLVSVQGLHRFYTRNDQSVVASWMTRQDREHAISDNITYVDRAVDAALDGAQPAALVFLGFSQGASMAARAAAQGAARAAARGAARPAARGAARTSDGLVILGGDIPPDAREVPSSGWPRVLVGVGSEDKWYGARVESDLQFLQSSGISHEVVRYTGGHEFTDEFRAAVGAWLERLRFGVVGVGGL